MIKFLKYEFTDEQWATIRPTLYSEDEEGNQTLIPAINAIVEIGHIKAEGAVLPQIHEMFQDQIDIFWLSIGGQSHNFVFSRINFETQKVCEC